MIRENILRDRNRASIIIWSVGNETPLGTARTAFLRTLVADARALDDSRLLGAALLTEEHKIGRIPEVSVIDPLAADLDVMAINRYSGWYDDLAPSEIPSITWRIPADKPLIFSEFGADAKSGFHDPRATPQKFSEEYQAAIYRYTLQMLDGLPTLAGLSPWILKDFRSPRRQNQFQQGWNRKGLISETGERKQAFSILADYYERQSRKAKNAKL
jgi:beta-glucuronidase